MQAQQEVSRELLAKKVGASVDVLIDAAGADGVTGRSPWDAPEIDGVVHLSGAVDVKVGDMVRATITGSDEYDLWASPMQAEAPRLDPQGTDKS